MSRILLACILGLAIPGVVGAMSPGRPLPQFAPPSLVLGTVAPKMSCEALALADPEATEKIGATIESATVVSAARGRHAYCRVRGYLPPQVRFQLELPLEGWTQRFLQVGCGGYCGYVGLAEQPQFPVIGRPPGPYGIVDPAQAGGILGRTFLSGEIARVTTDKGHSAPIVDTRWAVDNLPGQVDWGYRAVHEVARVSKAIIELFYGQRPKYSYYLGISDGGREALMETQRHPEDFDGVVAIAPAFIASTLNGIYQPWIVASNTREDGSYILTPEKLPALHAAVLAECDARDGLADSVIGDPRACRFDPASMQCAEGADRADCLTGAQVAAVRRLYSIPHDAGGRRLYPGGLPYGSERSWANYLTAPPGLIAMSAGYAGYRRNIDVDVPAGSHVRDWRIDVEEMRALRDRKGRLFDATDPDLREFRARGGKLMLIHGWADEAVPPLGSLAYWHAVGAFLGADAREDFMKLYLAPGADHGGNGALFADYLTPMMDWVESAVVPGRIVAYQMEGMPMSSPVVRSRPLFPHPRIARYVGSGSVDNAANFVEAEPSARYPDFVDGWADAFRTGFQQVCHWRGDRFACEPGKR